ncbi:zinc-binding dehydrogenase [Pelagicoccus sp. NFK12]|uniref:Zinc-binding dehydrogenase n=1 Tax=Pelagicoccus enzymogenes TaxID=2773457 RepID=A0A927IJC6_9BACT|nr:zinc-binding dehydrogenase [Pelagicoccus enzymogenes]MBD5781395.1 zinc-binding dehydrogenase [Pelagicoccus enzymogenes]
MKTLAAILVNQRSELELDEVEIPSLGYGQVLVEFKTSRICGSQIGEIDGVKGPDRWLPHLLGHEGGGIVREVGPEVSVVKPGDRVVAHWRPGAGIQARPPKYKRGSQIVNAGAITTFNHFSILSENRVTPIPNDFDLETAALLADTITTGFGIINRDAQARIGQSLLIFGAGGIGLGAILGASLAGLHPIVAVDIHPHKLDTAKKHGATHALLGSDEDLEEKLLSILGKQGADVVLDGTGVPSIIETCYRLTHPKGKTVLYGVMPSSKSVSLHTLPLHLGKTLTGSEGGGSLPAEDIPRLVRMIEDGRFDPRSFISHRGKLEDVNTLIAKMRSGEVIHAIMNY